MSKCTDITTFYGKKNNKLSKIPNYFYLDWDKCYTSWNNIVPDDAIKLGLVRWKIYNNSN